MVSARTATASFPHHSEAKRILQHVEIVIGVQQLEPVHQAVGADDHVDRLARCNLAPAEAAVHAGAVD